MMTTLSQTRGRSTRLPQLAAAVLFRAAQEQIDLPRVHQPNRYFGQDLPVVRINEHTDDDTNILLESEYAQHENVVLHTTETSFNASPSLQSGQDINTIPNHSPDTDRTLMPQHAGQPSTDSDSQCAPYRFPNFDKDERKLRHGKLREHIF